VVTLRTLAHKSGIEKGRRIIATANTRAPASNADKPRESNRAAPVAVDFDELVLSASISRAF
jgi:hypothetical protein